MTAPAADVERRPVYEPGSALTEALPIDAPAPPPRQIRVWDNANIVESFPDLTLPLTFSVAVGVYAVVYRGMCLALGVPRGTVEREGPVFEQMLGLLQGRVYYNLTSWYRVLALLPGFRLTAGFLEAMMGASRPGARGSERSVPVVAGAARSREIAGMTVRLSYRLLRFGSDGAHFRTSIARLLESHRDTPAPGALPEELLDEFERFRASALREWRAPIMNDLFLMLSHGALRRVADRWLGTDARSLVNALLVQGSVTSALPGKELLAIAVAIRERSAWSTAILSTPPEEMRARLDAEPELAGLARLIDGYLEAWGDRAPRELQLERPSYRDEPLPLLRAIRSLVSASATTGKRVEPHATRRVRRRLLVHPMGPLRLAVFWVLLRATRRHIRAREEMRLARGQVFAVGRRIFRRLGEVMSEQGVLELPDDVHFLSVDELRGMTRGTAVIGDPRALVRLRRAQYDDYASRPRLPSRFETRGLIGDPLDLIAPAPPTEADQEARAWRGIGAAPGRVRGPCLVVHDPSTVTLVPGQVIAARTTDPGWVPVLVGAAGLLVEQGSLLSHSAIVARELGIPTVVGLAGLLDVVRTGDILELDGSTGEVKLEAPLEGAA
jgi:pyruvate,water dikinase